MNQYKPKSGNVHVNASRNKKSGLSAAAEWITRHLKLEKQLTPATLSKIIWVGCLTLVYIYFQHNFDGLIRKTVNAEKVLEQDRAKFISHQARYLYSSKQSEIEAKLQGLGFTNQKSPVKISSQDIK